MTGDDWKEGGDGVLGSHLGASTTVEVGRGGRLSWRDLRYREQGIGERR